jgi:ABC-type dipeptide/oligopeptide/nickel transport system permease subunit
MDETFFLLMHSLLRYALLVLLIAAVIFSLRGVLLGTVLLNGHRAITVAAVALAHVQLAIGFILYIMRGWYRAPTNTMVQRFWKFEHLGMMLIAIILITVGRVLSKKAKGDHKKQLYIAVFFLIALLIMFWAIPWPFREIGFGRGWL